MKQRDIIKRYIESTGWIAEYKIHGIQTPWGFIGARGDRNVRQMLKDGILEGRMEGKFRMVRVKPKVSLPPAREQKEDTSQPTLPV